MIEVTDKLYCVNIVLTHLNTKSALPDGIWKADRI
jgi:hypothetical protein